MNSTLSFCFLQALCLNQRMLNLFVVTVVISFQTPLHLSAQNGHIEACRVLLQSNADVDARDRTCKNWRPPSAMCPGLASICI
jgi:hypothetical protein